MCGIAGFLNPRNNDKKTEKEICLLYTSDAADD